MRRNVTELQEYAAKQHVCEPSMAIMRSRSKADSRPEVHGGHNVLDVVTHEHLHRRPQTHAE